MTRAVAPEQMEWALAEAAKEALAVAPGWFRAWPSGDEKWSAVNIRAASQVIVNHSREDGRHPDSWTVRALYGGHAVELRVGPYETKGHAILVAHAILTMAFSETRVVSETRTLSETRIPGETHVADTPAFSEGRP